MDLVSVGQTAFSGIANGALYALIALGFSFVSRSTGIINFAQGDLVMMGGMLTAVLAAAGVPLAASAVLAILACALAGALFYQFAIRGAVRATMSQLTIITVGLSILLRGIATTIWGSEPRPVPSFTGDMPLDVFGVSILPQELWLIGALIVTTAGVTYFLKRSTIGLALRAGAANPLGAAYLGIDARKLGLIAFLVAGLLGGLAGAVWSPISYAQVDVGLGLSLKGFTAAILGGIDTAYGPIVGGLVLAIVEAFTAGYVSSAYQDAIIFGLLLVALIARPEGLLGRRGSLAREETSEQLLTEGGVQPIEFRTWDVYGLILGAVVLVGLGPFLSGTLLSSAVLAGVVAIVTIGMVLLTGYGGQLSLGQGAFMMIGAYSTGYLTVKTGWPPVLAMAVGVCISVAMALALGRVIFRLKGFYLSMASLGLLMIALTFGREATSITGGSSGLPGIRPFSIAGIQVSSALGNYYLIIAFVLLTLFLGMALARSQLGRVLLAVRSSESAARSCGVNVVGLKMRVFAFSGAAASIAGSLYAHYVGIANPEPFGIDSTIAQLTALTLGGFLSFWGAVLGSLVVVLLPIVIAWISGSSATQMIAGLQLVTFGVVLIGMILAQTSGIGPILMSKARGATLGLVGKPRAT